MKKNILFMDFNGVISHNIFWNTLIDDNQEKIRKVLFGGGNTIFKEWMIGKVKAEEVTEFVANQTGIAYEILFETLKDNSKNMDFSIKILEKLQAVKHTHNVVLATVNADTLNRWTIPNQKEKFSVFDEIINSHYLGINKIEKEGSFFMPTIKNFDTEMNNCILIDDSQTNCDFFEKLGGKAFCVKTEQEVVIIIENIL